MCTHKYLWSSIYAHALLVSILTHMQRKLTHTEHRRHRYTPRDLRVHFSWKTCGRLTSPRIIFSCTHFFKNFMFFYSLLRAWTAAGITACKIISTLKSLRWLAWCKFAPNLITTYDSSIILFNLFLLWFLTSIELLEKSRQITSDFPAFVFFQIYKSPSSPKKLQTLQLN